MTEFDKFQRSTMVENYKRLLSYIDSQMDTDEIDFAERETTCKCTSIDTTQRYQC